MSEKTPEARRVTYQPYIFALSLLILLGKLGYSAAQGQVIFDGLLGMFVLVFLISSLLWYLDSRNRIPQSKRDIDVSIQTGKTTDSTILGAETSKLDQAKVGIKTSDAENTEITGYREIKN